MEKCEKNIKNVKKSLHIGSVQVYTVVPMTSECCTRIKQVMYFFSQYKFWGMYKKKKIKSIESDYVLKFEKIYLIYYNFWWTQKYKLFLKYSKYYKSEFRKYMILFMTSLKSMWLFRLQSCIIRLYIFQILCLE